MRYWIAIGALLLGSIVPAIAEQRLSVAQFEEVIATLSGKPDAEAARRLSELRLTERLSASRFEKLQRLLPGEKSRQVLLSLSDESAFLNPPASEIPATAAPDVAEQRRMMSLVVAYVVKTVPKLPDFLATRATVRFADSPGRLADLSSKYQPLHPAGGFSAQVTYQDGHEVADNRPAEAASERGLRSWGEFGPILSTVLLDAARNKLAWLRWEQGDAGNLAVFSYSVPKESSHFEIDYCCVADSEGRKRVLHELAGYTGEMTVDPATGAIYRLKIDAEFKAGEPVSEAKIAVEYGPVSIGAKNYICPVHAITLSRGQSLSDEQQEIVESTPRGTVAGIAPVFTGGRQDVARQTLLNDVAFREYHVFGSEAQILTGATDILPPLGSAPAETTAPNPAKPATTPPPAVNAPAATQPVTATAPSASEGPAASQPATAAVSAPSASEAPAAVAASASAPAEPPAIPEISITDATGVPDLPTAQQPPAAAPGFVLRTTSRLVDVSVVAVDKKGRPVLDLRPEDFEMEDNGAKQQIRFFSRAGEGLAAGRAPAPDSSAIAAGGQEFSNRPAPAPAEGAGVSRQDRDVTILLIDASSLAFGDLSHARSEILRFVKTAPADEPMGIYILRKFGFEVLKEPGASHTELAAAFSKWMPSAQDLAQAQHEEQRNRQELESVHNVTDLLSLNGNTPSGGADIVLPTDPQLRSLGDNPSRDALVFLTWVSRHLAAFPGHKTLVWISSDNVLADFSDKAPRVEKGDKNIDPLALRARESLNEARASIYPLDASQLEAGGVGANLESANVQLTPTADTAAQLAALSPSDRQEAQEALNKSQRDMYPGRVTAQMQQDTHPIQGAFRELAEATGGEPLRRAGDIASELGSIVNDGRAAYLLSFTPDTNADDTYHRIVVKLANRRGITLRYRTGYYYSKEPGTIKERFQDAIWQPADIGEIALSATPASDSNGKSLKVTISATDLALAQQGDFWTDKVDVFAIERDDAALHAKLSGRSLALRLKRSSYEQALKEGLRIDVPVHALPDSGALRVIVADENSGRIGTLTLPASSLAVNR